MMNLGQDKKRRPLFEVFSLTPRFQLDGNRIQLETRSKVYVIPVLPGVHALQRAAKGIFKKVRFFKTNKITFCQTNQIPNVNPSLNFFPKSK